MKKLIILTIITGFLSINIGISIFKVKTAEAGNNDCMITYINSNKQEGYLYDLKEYNTFHIDTKKLKEGIVYGTSKRCYMKGSLKYGYYIILNSLFCGVTYVIN